MNDPAVIKALKRVTGYSLVRRVVGANPDGTARYGLGYNEARDSLVFHNELGQSCHVPKHRVEEALAQGAADDPDEDGEDLDAGDVDDGPVEVSKPAGAAKVTAAAPAAKPAAAPPK